MLKELVVIACSLFQSILTTKRQFNVFVLKGIISWSFDKYFVFFSLDNEPPTLFCPDNTMTVDNDKGKNTSTVSWNFTFTDNSLRENEPGITEDSFHVVLTINDMNVDNSLPKLLGIGTNRLKYVVTDAAGNEKPCSFTVEVRGKLRSLLCFQMK